MLSIALSGVSAKPWRLQHIPSLNPRADLVEPTHLTTAAVSAAFACRERRKTMTQHSLERDVLRCRYLITRGATDKLGLRDLESIEQHRELFVAECNAVFKKAQDILVQNVLALEEQIAVLNKKDQSARRQRAKLKHWKSILEACYDAFIWIASRNDRSNASKIYKGLKYGKLSAQNIESVIEAARRFNGDSHSFAIPLDFSRFSCVCDLLLIEFAAGKMAMSFFEVKEGKVNEAFFDTRSAGTQEAYFAFFEQYGEKGIQQGRRCFKQEKVLQDRTATFNAPPGVYIGAEEVRKIIQPTTTYEILTREVEDLLDKARRGDYEVEVFDNCLVLAAVDTSSRHRFALGQFDVRLFVHEAFVEAGAVSRLGSSEFAKELNKIGLTDWLEGLASIFLKHSALSNCA